MFFNVKTTEEVLTLLQGFPAVGEEEISLETACNRIPSRDLQSPENLPGFSRSTMDGYAVRAKDTFGASENMPGFFEIIGEGLIGQIPDMTVQKGQAMKIATGGMLPEGADGVVMVEYTTSLDPKTIEVSRTISPQENVIGPDDDMKKGVLIRIKGYPLRPQDIGLLAALGFEKIWAFRKPKVAIISTGDELVPLNEKPTQGRVRDINAYALSGFCEQMGAEPVRLGLCPDDFDQMRAMVLAGLAQADTLLISGGSSVGIHDLTIKVFESISDMELLAHGIAISPGKPTIIARKGAKAIFGLPGHPVSAMVVAEVFLGPFLLHQSGVEWSALPHRRQVLKARLSRNVESAPGREDYIRVKLVYEAPEWIAQPIFGKSGLISVLAEADGLVRVDRNREGLYQGQIVEVLLSGPPRIGVHDET